MTRKFQFYIVPTPIGNIDDITFRAVEILKEVDFIACEDTRVTQKLLNRYGIKTKCISYHKYNERERVEFFLEQLKIGKTAALVSDAGTPMICDPGGILIEELNKNGFTVTALPGACALTAFLSQISRNTEEFIFIGFMPRGGNQAEEVLKKYSEVNLVFYESPERILKTLDLIKNVRGNVRISIGRELSKLYEEVKTGTADEIYDYYKNGAKGEFVCMVYGEDRREDKTLDFKIKILQSKGFGNKDISVILSSLYGFNKNEVYKRSLET